MGGGSKKQTVGYKFYLGLHAVFTHGPVDGISRITFDKKLAWQGNLNVLGDINVNEPKLFGGEDPGAEGGVSGKIEFLPGYPDQPVNAYLQSKLLTDDIPAFRGVTSLIMEDFYCGTSKYIKPISGRMTRVHKSDGGALQWYDATAAIVNTLSAEGVPNSVPWIDRGTDYFVIGGAQETSGGLAIFQTWFEGYIDSVRVTKGTARYTTKKFDPPEFKTGDANDPFWSNVSTLLFLRGPNNGTDFSAVDQKGNVVEATGNTKFKNTQHKFGATSAYFDGSGDWLKVIVGADKQAMGATYTIEAWVCPTAYQDRNYGACILGCGPISVGGNDTTFGIGGENDDGDPPNHISMLQYDFPTSSNLVAIVGNIGEVPLNQWTHVAWCRDGAKDQYYLYINGNLATGSDAEADMNPAHIIRECLTNTTWGMGYQEGDIDDTAFTAAADILYAESFGLSFLWDRQMTIESFIGEVLKHIDAALFVDRKTGLFVLKLIRGDYDIEDVPVFNEDNIDKIEGFSRPVFGELVNSVSVNYWDADQGRDSSFTLTDPALIQMQGATINTTLQYPGITEAKLAGRVAMRDLLTLSNPLVSCTIYANSDAEDLTVGSVINFSWDDYSIQSMAMRVSKIAYGDGVKNAVKMTVTQDVFTMPTTSLITPPSTGWIDPNQPAAPIFRQMSEEMTYYEIVQRQGQSDIDARLAANPNIGLTAFAAGRPQDSAVNASIYIDPGSGFEEILGTVDFAPTAQLDAPVTRMQTTFVLKEVFDGDLIEAGTYATFAGVGEKVYIESYDTGTKELVVRRAVLDTVPEEHAEGDMIVFDDVYQSTDSIEYIASDMVSVKLLTVTGTSETLLSDAIPMTIEFDSRAARPYPPANVKVDGEYYPSAPIETPELTFSTRNRLLQTSPDLLGFTDTDVTPEVNTKVVVELYDNDDDTLLATYDPATSPLDMSADVVQNTRAELYSVNTVTSLESFRRVIVTFTLAGLDVIGNLADWSVGNDMFFTYAPDGGVGPYTWSISSGALPPGLSVDADTGDIVGYPRIAGTYTFDIHVEDDAAATGTVSQSVDIFDDADFSNVVTLLPLELGNGIIDIVGKVWSRRGDADFSSTQKKWGNGSAKFNGTNAYFSAPSHADFGLGTGDFTVDGWVYFDPASNVGDKGIFSVGSNGVTGGLSIGFQGGKLFAGPNGVAYGPMSASAATANTWLHIAAVKTAGNMNIYIDGVSVGSLADSYNYVTDAAYIGAAVNPLSGGAIAGFFNGYIDNFRVTKGVARWTSAFTPPPYPHPLNDDDLVFSGTAFDATENTVYSYTPYAVGGDWPYVFTVDSGSLPTGLTLDVDTGEIGGTPTAPGSYSAVIKLTDNNGDDLNLNVDIIVYDEQDADFANVKALLHFNGADGSTTFTDEVGVATWTRTNAITLSNSKQKFGETSLKIGGTLDWLNSSDASLNINSAPYTIEGWAYWDQDNYTIPNSQSVATLFSNWNVQANGRLIVYMDNTGSFAANEQGPFGSPNLFSATAAALCPKREWFHWAVTRDTAAGTGVVRVFINGVLESTTSAAAARSDYSNTTHIGAFADTSPLASPWIGYLDDVRITIGTCRYTSNFTPQSVPFQNS